jgi:hypothetical protein
MSSILKVAESFVNIRGSFKVGPLDVGTQCSLVKRKNGKWMMLDCVKLEPDVKLEVDQLTNNGADLESIVNLHPFHTVRIQLFTSFHQSTVSALLSTTASTPRMYM